jgi:hypothetical protein
MHSGFFHVLCIKLIYLRQVGPRKKALDLLAAAYLIGGRGAAYEVFAGLAHSEEGMAAFDSAGAAARMGLAPSA